MDLTLSGRLIDKISEFLKKRHKGKFMIINLSEKEYDYSLFDNQVKINKINKI